MPNCALLLVYVYVLRITHTLCLFHVYLLGIKKTALHLMMSLHKVILYLFRTSAKPPYVQSFANARVTPPPIIGAFVATTPSQVKHYANNH